MLRREVLALSQRAGEKLELVGQIHLTERVKPHELETLAEDVDGLVELPRAQGDGVGSDLGDDALMTSESVTQKAYKVTEVG